MEQVTAGSIYQHFRGQLYMIVAVPEHTETGEKYVVYRNVNTNVVWCRPYSMFIETIDRDDYHGPRFTLIRDWDTDYKKFN